MARKKVIWFVNKDAAPLAEYATHLRTVKQAQYFQKKGYEVKVVCSATVHNTDLKHLGQGLYCEERHDGVPFVFVKTLPYGQSIVKRVLAYVQFALNLGKVCDRIGPPDIMIHTARIPFDFTIFRLARRHGVRYILDITDLWPMEFEHFGFLSKRNPLLHLFYRMERYLYAQAEHVVMSMEGAHAYIRDRKWDRASGGPIDLAKVHYINNGIDLDEFRYNRSHYTFADGDLDDDTTYKVIYLGSIRLANDVARLIEAAKCLLPYPRIKVLIYGDGDERAMLEKRCRDERIDNVVFKQKWIEPQYVPYVLSRASVNVLNYGAGWAPYGGSMNKMFMAFASGKPIVCNAGMRYSPIREHDLGVDRRFADSHEYAAAILSLYHLPPDEVAQIAVRCERVAHEFHIPNLNDRFARLCNL